MNTVIFLLLTCVSIQITQIDLIAMKAAPQKQFSIDQHNTYAPPNEQHIETYATEMPNLEIENNTTPDKKQHKCPDCGATFDKRFSLNRHMKKHTGDKPWQCKHCPKKFAEKSDLKRHVRIHTGETPYVCPHCQKKFADRTNTKRHISSHLGLALHHCDICERSFTRKASLRNHVCSGTTKQNASQIYVKKEIVPPKPSYNQQQPIAYKWEPITAYQDGPGKKLLEDAHQEYLNGEIRHDAHPILSTGTSNLKINSNTNVHTCPGCKTVFLELSQLHVHWALWQSDKHFGCKKCTEQFYTLDKLKEHNHYHKQAALKSKSKPAVTQKPTTNDNNIHPGNNTAVKPTLTASPVVYKKPVVHEELPNHEMFEEKEEEPTGKPLFNAADFDRYQICNQPPSLDDGLPAELTDQDLQWIEKLSQKFNNY